MALKTLTNKKGSITPFLIIVAAGLVAVFVFTYTHFISVASAAEQKRYLEVASEDLLAAFDSSLLKNYGILAYDLDGAEAHLEKVLKLNRQANAEAKNSVDLDYRVNKTLSDNQMVAEVAVKVASYHMTPALMKELNNIYKFSDKVSDKVKQYEKVQAFANKVADIQRQMEDYYEVIEDLNDLNGRSEAWFLEQDEEKVINELLELEDEYDDCIRSIKKIRRSLDAVSKDYETLKASSSDNAFTAMLNNLDFDKRAFDAMFSEDGNASLEDVMDELKENKAYVREMIEAGEIDHMEDLNLDIFSADLDEEESGWYKVLRREKGAMDNKGFYSDSFSAFWQRESHHYGGSVYLNPAQSLMLNEYILGTFTAHVETGIRSLDFLTRLDRESTYPNGEVEYIIVGRSNGDYHIKMRIFGIRMGCNMMYLSTDREKFNIAKTIGSTICGWFPAGPCVGTVLVITTWSGIESYYDMVALCDGKGVAFIKSDDTWCTDLDLANKKIVRKHQPENMQEGIRDEYYKSYYNDYLRIMLMMVSNKTKVDRMLDVIQKNEKALQGEAFDLDQKVFAHELRWGNFLVTGDYYD